MIAAGLAGFGWWGQILAKSIAGKSDKIRVAQISSRFPDKIAEETAEIGAKTTDRFDAMLADPDVDVVILATPHSTHLDWIRSAAQAGKRIFAEKPLALTAADARAAFEAANAAGVIPAVGHNRRFHPSMRKLSELVETGALGDIVSIEIFRQPVFGFAKKGRGA